MNFELLSYSELFPKSGSTDASILWDVSYALSCAPVNDKGPTDSSLLGPPENNKVYMERLLAKRFCQLAKFGIIL